MRKLKLPFPLPVTRLQLVTVATYVAPPIAAAFVAWLFAHFPGLHVLGTPPQWVHVVTEGLVWVVTAAGLYLLHYKIIAASKPPAPAQTPAVQQSTAAANRTVARLAELEREVGKVKAIRVFERKRIDAPTSSAPCAAHKSHSPRPTYSELHHVVPRAWQALWQPATPPFPGNADGQQLWDDRMVPLCRTGHGNVHHWIAAVMKQLAADVTVGSITGQAGVDAVAVAAAKVRKAAGRHAPADADFELAQQAPIRFLQVDGDLRVLVAVGAWGEI